ncbi:rod shape-determining protein MreC [Campylobacter pinnipediorum]|uniref:Cell shape-determining protein MreC n=1 Tax=Campylobacter pinnipediorum subsp. pinnipediorum TaxID=1660067 RepID=A0AAX0L9N0_9BACT|nr:rod shape-determining protein MreC [Campylobacter pinnipediorum]AQW81904.1 rod shape-determining protein MreC [Campylobacter pinnipediorum subsp. pinnipediorum]AQW83579.1 rod shape-determining protein MreC [Campylobacter pinnipediorum subsp. pinnipediorum]AQW85101.1 rod shape-determining protein MreC [Campylobacter pinnipediorum subsp. pinnipediorum]OPA75927.1 rod shape-determining protein MreC [Campylobacter pinnipediorum subsp. pinnipediorum]OPA75964.1 rod shape-determining protein MreC [
MKTKIIFFIFIALLVVFSIKKGSSISSVSVGLSNFVVNVYIDITKTIKDKINEHFRQVDEIQTLRTQNLELEHSATLLSTFANELNQILQDKKSSSYMPKVALVKSLSYVNISDYNKIWISRFRDYNSSKIYGLMYQGRSAGIVVPKENKPMALLQNDPKSIFSVYIGDEKIPGVAHGNKHGIIIKYIPQWLSLKVGDEVFTSGLDGIFFSGVPVGKITKIYEESSYQSAIVEPYVKVNIPSYLYVVIKEK